MHESSFNHFHDSFIFKCSHNFDSPHEGPMFSTEAESFESAQHWGNVEEYIKAHMARNLHARMGLDAEARDKVAKAEKDALALIDTDMPLLKEWESHFALVATQLGQLRMDLAAPPPRWLFSLMDYQDLETPTHRPPPAIIVKSKIQNFHLFHDP